MNFTSNSNIDEHGSKRNNLKNSRILRAYSAIMCVYFLTLLVTTFTDRNNAIFILCIPGFSLYCLEFYMSFTVKPSLLMWLHYGVTVIFMIGFISMFGWNFGGQYFAFVIVAMFLTMSNGNIKSKALPTMVFIVICILLYGHTCFFSPLCEITTATGIYFQVVNFFAAVFAAISCLEIQMEDVRDMKERLSVAEDRLKHFISEDSLTGLSNRRTIMQYIEKLIEQRKQEGKSNICMAIGDIDSFSKINDRYGHDCGDIIIKQLAYQLSLDMKEKGKIARWGGEQFLFIFENATGEDAYYYLTKMQQHIRSVDFTWNDESINLTMTYGLMEYNPDKSIDYCIVEADKKMFMGKESGRNTIIY